MKDFSTRCLLLATATLACTLYSACKKEVDQSGGDHRPIAIAGYDKLIYTPNFAFELDGSKSFDADKNITSYLWKLIDGPPVIISMPNEAITEVLSSAVGVYHFELTVTDEEAFFHTIPLK